MRADVPAGGESSAAVGVLVGAAMAPGTFTSSLSARSAVDQGLVTGLATGLHYALSVGSHELLEAAARFLVEGAPPGSALSRVPPWARTIALDCAVIPIGATVSRRLPPRPGEPALRGLARQAAWRFAATGLGGALLIGAEEGLRRLDGRWGAHGRLAALPLSVPLGLGLSYVVERRRVRPGATEPDAESPSALQSLAVATGVVGSLTAGAYAEHLLTGFLGRRMAALVPTPPELWRLLGHGAVLTGLGIAVSAVWDRAMQRIEAGTSTDAPVIETDEGTRWVPSSVSGGPGSLVPWATLGREGRRHAVTTVHDVPVPDRPPGVPDLSIETVMGRPAAARPVQVYVGLDSAASASERVELALAEMERAGAFERSLIVLVSPTGTGYVNYVATGAVEYLTLGDVATVTMQYSRRPSPLSLGMVKTAREQNRLLWLRILERVRRRPGPRVVLFGESLGAHTSQDVFLHWGTLGLEALGIDRALWIGTPYGSKWMRQVTAGDRLDVDPETVAVVNDIAQLARLEPRRRSRVRYVLLSHDNDGVTRFGLDLLWTPPRWLDADRPAPEPADAASPRGVPAGMRWRPITTFFQSLIDMKNAQTPGPYRAWAHDYRSDLPRFISEVYGLPATPQELDRIETALRERETVREELFAAGARPAVAATG